jgi:hypothetical protein
MKARALEAAIGLDPTMGDRYSEAKRAALLADLDAFVDRLATAVSANDPRHLATFSDMVAVRYRKRRVPMDDLATLCEGLRQAAGAVVEASSMPLVDAALDEAIRVFKWHRRIAGDARKRHPLLAFIYKGA